MFLWENYEHWLYYEPAGLKRLPPQDGLMVDIDIEKISWTTVYDRTGNWFNWTIAATATVTTWVKDINHSIDWNEWLSSFITYAPMYAAETIEVWFKYNSSNNWYVVCWSTWPRVVVQHYSGALYFTVRNPSDSSYFPYKIIGWFYTVWAWHHIVVYWDWSTTANAAKIYKNWELVWTTTANTARTSDHTSDSSVCAYSDWNCATFRKWDRILTDKEIKYLYNNGYWIK